MGCGLWEDAPFLLITEWVRFVKFINRLRSSSSCTAWLTDWLLARGAWGHDGSLRYNKKPPWALTFSGTPMRFSIYTAKTVLSSSPPTATCLHSLSCPLLTANALPFSVLSTQHFFMLPRSITHKPSWHIFLQQLHHKIAMTLWLDQVLTPSQHWYMETNHFPSQWFQFQPQQHIYPHEPTWYAF